MTNGSFEAPDASGGDVSNGPAAPWVGFGDPNVRFTTATESFDGDQSLKTFGPFGFIGDGAGGLQSAPATPGTVYVGEIYALQQSADALQGGNFGVYKLEFLDAGGGFVGGSPILGFNVFESNPFNAMSPLDEWTLLGVGGLAPAGTASVQAVIVQVQLGDATGGIVGGAIFWDAATVIAIPEPSSFALAACGLAGVVARRRRA
ncbi:MAG: PEP-CTERM sorting domain-containing protein [Planctomycetota bacterium]